MDFLDPKKKRAHTIRLFLGYGLVGMIIAAATTILLYQAYGFGLDKNGQIVQKGLVYISSQPAGAEIYLDGVKSDNTNAKFNLKAGQYEAVIKRDGYRDWQHTVSAEGGAVVHYEYPFLFPVNLSTATTQAYDFKPTFITQSPDRRWLLVARSNSADKTLQFTQYDTKNPKAASTNLVLSASVSLINAKQDSWQVVEWSNDNDNVLLKHVYDGGYEYVLFNRNKPDQSINLTKTISGPTPEIRLLDKKYDNYVVFDRASQTLNKASLKQPTQQLWQQNVLEFETYGDDIVLLVTGRDAEAGKAIVKLVDGDKTYVIRSVIASEKYLLNLAKYENDWVVAAGSSVEDKVYVYLNPIAETQKAPQQALTPISTLRVKGANTLQFSHNARFIMSENGSNFSVYDNERDKTYVFNVASGLDQPQTKANWMDGHRLYYVSAGKLVVIDFDNTNAQTLMPADPNYLPLFDTEYKFVYSLVANETGNLSLTNTALRLERDM